MPDKPVPTVDVLPVPVNFPIENPAVVLTDTFEVISPSVFDDVEEPFAFQLHPTTLPESFIAPKADGIVTPSLSKEFTLYVSSCASSLFVYRTPPPVPVPLTES